MHITCLELGSVRLGLQAVASMLREPATVVRLKLDSTVAIGPILNSTSSSAPRMDELRQLHAVTTALGVELQPEHLPSALNIWADRSSREHDRTDWTLSHAGRSRLEALLRFVLDQHDADGHAEGARVFAPGYWPAARRETDLRNSTTNAWLTEILALLGERPPLGGSYSGHSL